MTRLPVDLVVEGGDLVVLLRTGIRLAGSAAFLFMTATTERAAPFTASGMGEAAGRNGDDGQAEILQTAMNVITARVIRFQIQNFISALYIGAGKAYWSTARLPRRSE